MLERVPELLTEPAVDDEVNGGFQRQQQHRDVAEQHHGTRGFEGVDTGDGRVDDVWSLAYEEHDNDADEHRGDLHLLSLDVIGRPGHRQRPLDVLGGFPHLPYETTIEYEQDNEG